MNASFEEQSVRITLGSLVAVYVLYFFLAGRMLLAGVTEVIAFAPLLVITTVLLVVVLSLGHVIVAVATRVEGRDERDELIEWRAEHNSSWVLGAGAFLAICGLATSVGPAWIANGLLASMFLSEVLKRLLQLHYYQRGS
jgi:hypothetical protein